MRDKSKRCLISRLLLCDVDDLRDLLTDVVKPLGEAIMTLQEDLDLVQSSIDSLTDKLGAVKVGLDGIAQEVKDLQTAFAQGTVTKESMARLAVSVAALQDTAAGLETEEGDINPPKE